jgi:hypothetical protein
VTILVGMHSLATLRKSNKGCSNIPPLQNIIQDEGLEEIVYGDDEKCELLNTYFSFISSLEDANVPPPDIELKTGAAIFSGQIFNIL